MLPLVLILQNILSIGGVFPEIANKPGLKQASYVASAQWGFSAEAATADVNHLQATTNIIRKLSGTDVRNPDALHRALTTPVTGQSVARWRWYGDGAPPLRTNGAYAPAVTSVLST